MRPHSIALSGSGHIAIVEAKLETDQPIPSLPDSGLQTARSALPSRDWFQAHFIPQPTHTLFPRHLGVLGTPARNPPRLHPCMAPTPREAPVFYDVQVTDYRGGTWTVTNVARNTDVGDAVELTTDVGEWVEQDQDIIEDQDEDLEDQEENVEDDVLGQALVHGTSRENWESDDDFMDSGWGADRHQNSAVPSARPGSHPSGVKASTSAKMAGTISSNDISTTPSSTATTNPSIPPAPNSDPSSPSPFQSRPQPLPTPSTATKGEPLTAPLPHARLRPRPPVTPTLPPHISHLSFTTHTIKVDEAANDHVRKYFSKLVRARAGAEGADANGNESDSSFLVCLGEMKVVFGPQQGSAMTTR
ncbi:hypothetical protein HDU93_002886 [Gonapodya sp. JEL0774]|nr:hypothetical protein HDU93_002886 [Gonapodya sp. JEL0774]